MKKKSVLLQFNKKITTNYIAILVCSLFIAAGILISIHRFWQYEVSYVDFGQYDQTIWRVSRFQPPIMHHFIHGNINVLGDHVTPSIFLLSPIYWFTDRSEAILIIQAIAVGLSGLVFYDIARRVIGSNLLALSLLVSYFLFVGLQNAVITEFHELTVMTLPLMLTFWAIVKSKKILFFVFLLITLGFKEITFALGISIGIAMYFIKPEWRKISLVTIFISILWAILAFKVIIPYFSNGEYLYAQDLSYNAADVVVRMFDHQLKRNTLFFSFFSFSFLPIFAPQFWFAFLQDYGARFLPLDFETRWGLGMHYNAQSAVLLAVSSAYGISYVLRKFKLKKFIPLIAVVILLNAIILYQFILRGPFALAYNRAFYAHTKNFAFLDDMVSKIPKDAVVMTHNNLATRFTHQEVYLIREYYNDVKPDYFLFDLRSGQNPNNYFGGDDIRDVLQALEIDKSYAIIYKTNDQRIYQRKR